jgi:hypothetical protein
MRRAHVEAGFSIAPSHDRNGGARCPGGLYCAGFPSVRESFTSYHLDGALRYDLLRSEVRPFLSLGAGHIWYDGGNRDNWALNVGAGVHLRLAQRAYARMDAIDHIIPDDALTGRTEHDVQVRVGVTLRP